MLELAKLFNITTETIRRDLDILETTEPIQRVHGGVVLKTATNNTLKETSLNIRQKSNTSAKQKIAASALHFLPTQTNSSIVLDAGSTTGIMAKILANKINETKTKNLLVITHAIPVAATLVTNPKINVELIGGKLRSLTQAAIGPQTVKMFNSLHTEVAFVGSNGIDKDFGLSTPDSLEAAVKNSIIKNAQRVVLLADSSKIGVKTLSQFAKWEQIDVLITDKKPVQSFCEALHLADVEIVLT